MFKKIIGNTNIGTIYIKKTALLLICLVFLNCHSYNTAFSSELNNIDFLGQIAGEGRYVTSIDKSEDLLAIGTTSGLVIIEGNHHSLFAKAQLNVARDEVNDVLIVNNKVFIATYEGILYVDIITQKSYAVPQLNPNKKNKYCMDLEYIDLTKIAFVCDNNFAIFNLEKAELSFVFEKPKGDGFYSFVRAKRVSKNKYLIGSYYANLFLLDLSRNNIESLYQAENNVELRSLTYKGDGAVFFSTSDGVYFLDNWELIKSIDFKDYDLISASDIYDIIEKNNNTYLFATLSNGLFTLDRETGEVKRYEVSGFQTNERTFNFVQKIFKENDDTFYLASSNGVYRVSNLTSILVSEKKLSDRSVVAIKRIGQEVFILTDSGIYKYSDGKVDFWAGRGEYALDLDFYENLFLLTSRQNGLIVYSKEGRIINLEHNLPDHQKNEYSQFHIFDNGNYILGTYLGENPGLYLGNINGDFERRTNDSYISHIESYGEGKALVSSFYGGVYSVDEKFNISHWPSENNLKVYCAIKALNNDVYICSANNGVYELMLNSGEYLPLVNNDQNNFLTKGILDDHNDFSWLFSGNGLKVFDKKRNNIFSFSIYDGVKSVDYDFNSYLDLSKDSALVGSTRGLYILDKELAKEFVEIKSKFKTKITGIEINAQSKDDDSLSQLELYRWHGEDIPSEDITLTHDSIITEFNLVHNNFEDRHHIGFEVRMAGLNDNWRKLPVDRDSVTYTTLPAGNYVFEARAVDPRSIVDQPISRVYVTVLPPWWLTWQAYTAYIIILALILYTFYRFRVAQLNKRNVYLEKTVAERTQTINQLLEQKQTFFANVSHEFRTPLTLILGPLDKLAKSVKETDVKSQLDTVMRNARRLKNMVDQILELARLETSKTIPMKVYDLKSVIDVVVKSFESLVANKQQSLVLDNRIDAKAKLLDDSLERILINLISNAVKYSPKGSEIKVESCKEETNLVLKVTDNGPGISEDDKDKIFQRFTRLEVGEAVQGSGIGLALVSELVDGNSGSIEVESKMGQGTVFKVMLPLLDEDSDEEAFSFQENIAVPTVYHDEIYSSDDESHSKEDAAVNDETDERLHILVVEDNPDLRSYILESLETEYKCTAARDGAEGVLKAQEQIPDLILSDVLMPKMNGFELSKTIREDESTSHVPIILLTAKGDEESRMTGWRENVDDFIAKPFNVDELKLRMARLISIREILKKRYAVEVANNLATKNKNPISFQSKRDMEFFAKFEKVVEENYMDEEFNRTTAASKLALSERQLNRKLSALVDYNFSEYLRKFRLQKAKEAMLEGQQITQVAFDVGFTSASYFTSCFKAEFGITPKQFIEQETSG